MSKDGGWRVYTDVLAALSDKKLSDFDKKVFVYLRISASNKNTCWPSYEAIMVACAITSRNSLSRSIKKISSLGYFKITKRSHNKKRHNLYGFASTSTPYLQKEFLAVEREFCKYGEELLAD